MAETPTAPPEPQQPTVEPQASPTPCPRCGLNRNFQREPVSAQNRYECVQCNSTFVA